MKTPALALALGLSVVAPGFAAHAQPAATPLVTTCPSVPALNYRVDITRSAQNPEIVQIITLRFALDWVYPGHDMSESMRTLVMNLKLQPTSIRDLVQGIGDWDRRKMNEFAIHIHFPTFLLHQGFDAIRVLDANGSQTNLVTLQGNDFVPSENSTLAPANLDPTNSILNSLNTDNQLISCLAQLPANRDNVLDPAGPGM